MKIATLTVLALAWALPLAATVKTEAKAGTPAPKAEQKTKKKEAAPKLDSPAIEASMKKAGCFACHQVKRKVVGPSYLDIAKKYKGDKKAVETLVSKVKKGGSGVWGKVPMAGHPKLKDEEIELMVRWVLTQE